MLVLDSRLLMNSENDPRAEELGQLKLALATFALHLDAFEMLTHEVCSRFDKPGHHVPRANMGRGSRKDEVTGGQ
jgi:hypothetical protein